MCRRLLAHGILASQKTLEEERRSLWGSPLWGRTGAMGLGWWALMAREASQRATDHQATERGGRGLWIGEGIFSQEDGCGEDNSLEEGKRSFRGSPLWGRTGAMGLGWWALMAREVSQRATDKQATERAGGGFAPTLYSAEASKIW